MAAVTTGAIVAGSTLYAANRADKAADQQAEGGRDAIRSQEAARAQAREDLMPYAQFGQDLLPQLQSRLTDPTEISQITTDPLYQALFGEATRSITANQAAEGKLGSGDTIKDLTNSSLSIGYDIYNNKNRDLFNAVTIGQNAAAGQGSATLGTGNNISDLQTQIGNTNAAGTVAKTNALTKGLNQGIGLYDLLNPGVLS